jgi:hypothetical protein
MSLSRQRPGMDTVSLPRLAALAFAVALLGLAALPRVRGEGPAMLTSRSRQAAVAPKVLTVGEEVRTPAGQKRRVALADRFVLLVNEKTTVNVKEAFEAEPTNAQILWDRARNLAQAGQAQEAEKLYRRLAEGTWQPRFAGLCDQARWQLEKQR